MINRTFLERITDVLIKPSQLIKENIEAKQRHQASLYVLYLSVIISVVLWFFIYYPEVLYYGVSGTGFQKDMPTFIFPDPLIFLFMLILASIANQFLFQYLFIGYIGYKINIKLSTSEIKRTRSFKDYLSNYAFSFTPFLFLVPILTFWLYFFERLIFMKPIFPLFDLTIPNIILLAIFTGCFAWKYYIEIQINKTYFGTSTFKAAVPVLIQIALLVSLFLSLYLFLTLFEDQVVGGLII